MKEILRGLYWVMALEGMLTAVVLAGILIKVFIVAYLAPGQVTTIAINMYGEANVEAWLLGWSCACMVVSTVEGLRKILPSWRGRAGEAIHDR
jgi:hypothetical protein